MPSRIFLLLLTASFALQCRQPSEVNGKDPLFRIGLVADPQYQDTETAGLRNYRASLSKLREAIDTFNHYNVAAVQTLGDVINGKWESFDSILPVYNHLDKSVESYHLLGNHDLAIDSVFMPGLLSKLGMKDFYYSYIIGNWRFIVLDGTDYMQGSLPLHPGHREFLSKYRSTVRNSNNREWNGAVGPDQQAWMITQLDSAKMLNQKVILFCHMPIRSEQSSGENLLNDYEIDSIITRYPDVEAFINGHYHGGRHVVNNGIDYITIKGMVEAPGNAFAILEIYTDHFEIRTLGYE